MSVEFKDNTQEFLSLLDSAKNRGLKAISMTAELYAKKETPVDTGRLRNSISNTADKDAAYIGTICRARRAQAEAGIYASQSRHRAHSGIQIFA